MEKDDLNVLGDIPLSASSANGMSPPSSDNSSGVTPPPSAPGGIGNGAGGGILNELAIAAEKAFLSFLNVHQAQSGEIREDELTLDNIAPGMSHRVQLTKFTALDDTLLFSRLISKLLEYLPPPIASILVDIGAGSSIPTLRALLEHREHSRLQVVAVDNDTEAISISERNAAAYNLSERYTFISDDVGHFLSNWNILGNQAIVANLPYLPTPQYVADNKYAAVNGGPDGTRYIEALLTHSIPEDTLIAIQWSSLSNPLKIIEMIKQSFEVLYLMAYRAPFGTYTGSPALFPHLQSQRLKGQSVFTTDSQGNNHFTFVGTILRRR